jgi:hypothetical protein
MTVLIAIAFLVITLALAPRTYRYLKSRRAERRSEWQLDRTAWRLWMLRP